MLDEGIRPARSATRTRSERDLRQCEAEAHHHRQRLALYTARVLTGRPSRSMRLAELRRISAGANARLARAKAALRDAGGSSRSA